MIQRSKSADLPSQCPPNCLQIRQLVSLGENSIMKCSSIFLLWMGHEVRDCQDLSQELLLWLPRIPIIHQRSCRRSTLFSSHCSLLCQNNLTLNQSEAVSWSPSATWRFVWKIGANVSQDTPRTWNILCQQHQQHSTTSLKGRWNFSPSSEGTACHVEQCRFHLRLSRSRYVQMSAPSGCPGCLSTMKLAC